MTQTTYITRMSSSRLSLLKTSVSILTLLSAPGFMSVANAQTTVNDGDNVAVTTSADAETITVTSGVTSVVADAPVITAANSNVVINNAGTLRTTGVTQTIQFNADTLGSVLNNAATGSLEAESRVVNIDGDDITVNNSGSIIGTGDQRNGTVYANRTANNFSINNIGAASLIDSGVGNQGAGIALEIGGGGNPIAGSITNEGTIQGRGQSITGGTVGDGLRFFGPGLAPVYEFSGDINNSGTIASEGAASVVSGVRFSNRINFAGTLTNSETGVISGVNNGLYFGDADHSQGVVDNAGTISSDSRALNIDGVGLTVNNTGSILGTGSQRNGTVYADSTAQDFTLNNSGTVDAGVGNNGAAFSAELSETGNEFSIDNSGFLVGRGQAGAGEAGAGDGIRFERTRVGGALDGTTTGLFTGTVTNSGSITSEATAGTTAGIRFVNGVSFQGTLNNEIGGVISGVNNGLYFGNPTPAGGGDHTGGVVNNAGTISSDSRALNIDGLGLTVNNTGSILGTGNQRNGTVYADSTAQDFSLNNSGTIDAGADLEGAGFSVELSEAGNNFTINNSGLIQGRGQAGAGTATAADGLRFERTRVDGALDGSTAGLFTGSITNSGSIRSEATTGTTGGIRFVNGVSFQGTLTNEEGGVIYGTNNGLYFGNPTPAGGGNHTGGIVNNAGTITSASRALNIDGIGLVINNTGNIVGQGNQRNGTVYADSTAQDFTLNNSGTVDAGAGNEGAGFSVELSEAGNEFAIINSGDITGRGQASAGAATAGDGLRFERTRVDGALEGSTTGLFTGTIINSGNITSEATAGTTGGIRFVNGVSFQGTLTNEAGGVISGVNNGLYFGNAVPVGGADHTGGVVNNAGTISSDSRALNIDGLGLTVNNSGSILGTGNQRNGTVYFDGTSNNVTLNNLVGGVIDAGAGNSGSGVSIEALAGTRTHTITNAGTIQGRGDALASGEAAGIRAFYPPNMMRPVVDLTINNSGFIGSETSAGILFENITVAGSITNSGTISGTAAAIDTRTSLGNVLINQVGGSLNGDVLTGSGNDVLNITGGALNGNIDLGAGTNLVNIASPSGFGVDIARSIASDVAISNSILFGVGGQLVVDGDVSLADSTSLALNFTDVTGLNFGQSLDVITATGVLSGNGASFVDNSFLVDFDLVNNGSALTLTPTVANLSAVSSDANTNAFGGAFASALGGGGDAAFAATANAINTFTSDTQFESAAAALLPTLNNGVLREIYETQSEVLSLIDDRVSPSASEDAGLWGQVFVRSADRGREGSLTLTGYDATAYGFVLGADTLLGDATRAGIAFSYTDLDIDETSGARENTSVEGYAVSAYFAYEQGAAFINGALSYSFNDAEAQRTGLLGNAITGEFDVDQFAATLKAGHTRRLNSWEVTPFASLEYATLSQDDFSERGGLNLDVDASGIDLFEAGVGVKLALPSGKSGFQLKPEVSVGYYYDFIGDQNLVNASFAGSNAFALEGVDPSRSSFEVDASVGLYASEKLSVLVGYDGEFRSGYSSHGGTARLRFKF